MGDITESRKEILLEVFKYEPIKIELINRSTQFIFMAIEKNKLAEYSINMKGAKDGIDLLDQIKYTLEDLYNQFESIKDTKLSKLGRNFVGENIDLISIILILMSLDTDIIPDDILTKILSFVKSMINLDIDMKVERKFLFCCR